QNNRRSWSNLQISPRLAPSGSGGFGKGIAIQVNSPYTRGSSGTSPRGRRLRYTSSRSISADRKSVPYGGHPLDLFPEEILIFDYSNNKIWLQILESVDVPSLRLLNQSCSSFMDMTNDMILMRSIEVEPLKSFYVAKYDVILNELCLSDYKNDDEDDSPCQSTIDDLSNVTYGFDMGAPAIPISADFQSHFYETDVFDLDLGYIGPILLDTGSSTNHFVTNPNGISLGPAPIRMSATNSLFQAEPELPPLPTSPRYFSCQRNQNHNLSGSFHSLVSNSYSAASAAAVFGASPSESASSFESFEEIEHEILNLDFSAQRTSKNKRLSKPSSCSCESLEISSKPVTSATSADSLVYKKSQIIAERTWDVVMQLFLHIDDYVASELSIQTPEPQKWTDDFTQWVNFDPMLTGIERQRLYDEWYRKHGGRSGRSLSRLYAEREESKVRQTSELKLALARLWAIKGRLFPFTRAENTAWRKKLIGRKNDDSAGRKPIELIEQPEYLAALEDSAVSWNQQPRKPRRPNRSGEAEFRRAIVAPVVTVDTYLSAVENVVEKLYIEGEAGDVYSGRKVNEMSTSQILTAMKCFAKDTTSRVLRFPMGLETRFRRQLHEVAIRLGLRTMSFGDGNKRFLIATKRDVVVFRD
ncbi:hypothetical protein HK096_003317, partial [Nowakowskiella sp. JEL0078]